MSDTSPLVDIQFISSVAYIAIPQTDHRAERVDAIVRRRMRALLRARRRAVRVQKASAQ